MRILFLGDVLGRSGRDAVNARLPALRERLRADLVVVNGENASHGFGIAPAMAQDIFNAGADVITLGNHAWDRKEIIPYIAQQPRLVRPLNFPPGTPGAGSHLVRMADGRSALVVNVMGRLFMDPLDDPFRTAAELLARHKLGASVQAIVLDFHAEATSETMSFAHSFDGSVSLVVGTHTHIPTADHTILPGGTAYQTDAGMCGDYDSVIGMNKQTSGARFWTHMPGERMNPAEGEATICGLFVITDDATGLATAVEPLRQGGRLSQTFPAVEDSEMAGHSQFKNIMHRKGAQDAKRARHFAKLIREITVSARQGLPDPAFNPRLRAAMAAAREANMPRDTIERAVKKAMGAGAGDDYVEVRYEGYGPSGVAVIVEALTDNRNRTAGDVRSAFNKHGGALGETNSVSFVFNRLGVIQYPPAATDADAMLEAAIEAGAEDAASTPEGHEVTCGVEDFFAVRDGLEARFGAPASARLEWRPTTTVTLDEDSAAGLLKLVDALEDNDDVQNVYANFDIPEAVLARLSP